ncbi:alpha/beta hydrolase [Streptomyces anulatus]|uniref:alpha/beta hydrolase n=1 Tax=Streptomyces anulatus TaxID=1892 RepID=UPI002E36B77F|nr:alpha/beta hydrolase [Streptomyces anulatus]WTD23166.1 alpha/beta hydrolase [Streptomyces anulatus]
MHRNRAVTQGIAACAVTAAALAGLSSATVPDIAEATSGTLRWGSCKDVEQKSGDAQQSKTPRQSGKNPLSRLECATLEVPLDYRDPDGRKIGIAVSRLTSENPSKRRGALLVNPGGPGLAGLGYPVALALSGLPQAVQDTYDLIGFDPRGVGRSTPVTCDLTPEQLEHRPLYARTAADVTKEAAHARDVARQCAGSKTSWMLPHVSTANTARDMDQIRAALGKPKISYFGGSYGTYLGAVFTTLFPAESDRIVLDSNLGPKGYDVSAARLFGRGMEDRLPDFAKYAAAHPEYNLGGTQDQVERKFTELAERLEKKPARGYDGARFRTDTFSMLYLDSNMPLVAETWQSLDTGRQLPPSPPTPGMENATSSRYYVTCNDSRWPVAISVYQRNTVVDRERYPMMGGSTANIGPCAFWPDEPTEPQVQIGDRGPSNVLMVQNERDPGTPLAGAKKLRKAFGTRATMVTADQGGHGLYPHTANTCATDAVTTYLTTGKRPAQDLACPAEQPSGQPGP